MKKILSIVIIIVMLLGWFFSINGFGEGGSIAERMKLGLDMIGGVSVVLEADTDATGSELKSLMDQVQAVMEKRVNEMGLSEPVITVENENRIRIELPGAQNAQEAIESIGKTAQLSFRTADDQIVVTGENVKNAVAEVYQGTQSNLIGTYVVQLEFDAAGADAFADATRRILAGEITPTLDGYYANQILILLDDDEIRQRLQLPGSVENAIRQWLRLYVAPRYEGPVGVDLLKDKNSEFFVSEMNLRYTMGLVAHAFLEAHPDRKGSRWSPTVNNL